MNYRDKKPMLLTLWRISVLVLLLLNLLVACQNLQHNRAANQSVAAGMANISRNVPQPLPKELLVGRVVRIADGDTVTVLDANNAQHRIRLTQIDAPESKQAFSRVSKDALSDLIASKEVIVKIDGIDRYQRVLGEIFVADKNINLHMVRQGFAWAYTQYVTDNSYFEAQEAAKKERLGLWRDPHPIAPWEYRRQQREQRN